MPVRSSSTSIPGCRGSPRDRSVETTRTRYDTRGRPRGRRVVSGALEKCPRSRAMASAIWSSGSPHKPGAMPRALTQHAPVARSGSRAGRAGAPPALDLPAASGHHPPGSQPSQTTYIDVMKIRVVVHEAEEGGYWAEVPAIPGRAFPSEGCRGKAVVRLCAVQGGASTQRAQAPGKQGHQGHQGPQGHEEYRQDRSFFVLGALGVLGVLEVLAAAFLLRRKVGPRERPASGPGGNRIDCQRASRPSLSVSRTGWRGAGPSFTSADCRPSAYAAALGGGV